MPNIIGSYKVVKVGHKVLVESDVKPGFKGGKVCPAYYAIQVKSDKGDCILLSEKDINTAKIVTGQIVPGIDQSSMKLGVFVAGKAASIYIKLFNEANNREDVYCFYKNTITRGFERAKKYPHLCTKIQKSGFFAKLFS